MEFQDGNGVNSLHGASNCLVINSRIEGNSKIGGIYGEIRDGTIEHSTVNAEIIANEGVAGGIIGYMENKNMTAANVYIKMFNNNVANSMIVGPTKIGGLVGDIERELYINERIKFYYNNYVHAKLESYDEKKYLWELVDTKLIMLNWKIHIYINIVQSMKNMLTKV